MKGGPVVVCSLSATIGSVRKSELELITVGQFIYCDEVVVVAELFYGREVSVLFAVVEWCVRISESVGEFVTFK